MVPPTGGLLGLGEGPRDVSSEIKEKRGVTS